MGAEPGRRFLKQPAEKLKAVFVVFEHVFLSFRIFEQLALTLINTVAQKFFAVWNILLTF